MLNIFYFYSSPLTHDLKLSAEDILLSRDEQTSLLLNHAIIFGRILAKHLPGFSWLNKVLPCHIEHPHEDQMAQKSEVFPLPLLFKNESKYEDCVAIMDSYEDYLIELYSSAFGK